jgi:hypothetical protein
MSGAAPVRRLAWAWAVSRPAVPLPSRRRRACSDHAVALQPRRRPNGYRDAALGSLRRHGHGAQSGVGARSVALPIVRTDTTLGSTISCMWGGRPRPRWSVCRSGPAIPMRTCARRGNGAGEHGGVHGASELRSIGGPRYRPIQSCRRPARDLAGSGMMKRWRSLWHGSREPTAQLGGQDKSRNVRPGRRAKKSRTINAAPDVQFCVAMCIFRNRLQEQRSSHLASKEHFTIVPLSTIERTLPIRLQRSGKDNRRHEPPYAHSGPWRRAAWRSRPAPRHVARRFRGLPSRARAPRISRAGPVAPITVDRSTA